MKTVLSYGTSLLLLALSLHVSAWGRFAPPPNKQHRSGRNTTAKVVKGHNVTSPVFGDHDDLTLTFHGLKDNNEDNGKQYTATLIVEEMPNSHHNMPGATELPSVRTLHIMVDPTAPQTYGFKTQADFQKMILRSFAKYLWNGYKGEKLFYKVMSDAFSERYMHRKKGHGHLPIFQAVSSELNTFSGRLMKEAKGVDTKKSSPCCGLIITREKDYGIILDISGGIVAHY